VVHDKTSRETISSTVCTASKSLSVTACGTHAARIPNGCLIPSKMFHVPNRTYRPSWTYSKADIYRGSTVFVFIEQKLHNAKSEFETYDYETNCALSQLPPITRSHLMMLKTKLYRRVINVLKHSTDLLLIQF